MIDRTKDTLFLEENSVFTHNPRAKRRNPVHEIPLLWLAEKIPPLPLQAIVIMDPLLCQARYFSISDADQLLGILEEKCLKKISIIYHYPFVFYQIEILYFWMHPD